MVRFLALVSVAVAVFLSGSSVPASAKATNCKRPRWVESWASALSIPGPVFVKQTLRMVVNPHFPGRELRVRLSNRLGSDSLRLNTVTVAIRRSQASLVPGSSRTVRFDGERRVVIPPGKQAVSDRVRLRVAPFQDLAVSVYVRRAAAPASIHLLNDQITTYKAAGDRTKDVEGAAFGESDPPMGFSLSWSYLSGVDVVAPGRSGTLVAFGDSITEGWGSAIGRPPGERDTRYPDFLARRVRRAGLALSVVNEGVDGDTVQQALSRLKKDVLAVPGVTDVIVLEGINDVWYTPEPAAAPVITDLRKIIERLHRAGIRALVGTLTPYRFRDPARNSMRAAINRWIRRSEAPDGVIDFDRALRAAGDPSTMRTRYGGPQLHPNMRGFRRMANAVPLKLLKERSCR